MTVTTAETQIGGATVPPGTKVQVLSKPFKRVLASGVEGDWVVVRLADGRKLPVPKDNLGEGDAVERVAPRAFSPGAEETRDGAARSTRDSSTLLPSVQSDRETPLPAKAGTPNADRETADRAIEAIKAAFRRVPGGGNEMDDSRASWKARGKARARLDRISELAQDANEALDWSSLRSERSEEDADPLLRELLAATLELFGLSQPKPPD